MGAPYIYDISRLRVKQRTKGLVYLSRIYVYLQQIKVSTERRRTGSVQFQSLPAVCDFGGDVS